MGKDVKRVKVRDMKKMNHLDRQRIADYVGRQDRVAGDVLRYAFCGSQNCSWAKVAMLIGGNNTADGVRMIAERSLKNVSLPEYDSEK